MAYNKVHIEISTGESMGGLGNITTVCGFKDGHRVQWWSWAHHIDGPMPIDSLAMAVADIIRNKTDWEHGGEAKMELPDGL